MLKNLRKYCLLSVLACLYVGTSAQVTEQSSGEVLENYFRDTEQASESNAQDLLETLENYKINPLNLNTATKDELVSLGFLNDLQVQNFLNYRATLGSFLNVYELQAVPGWELQDISKILEFSTVKTGIDTRRVRLRDGFRSGDNELLLRWGRPSPVATGNYEGGPNAFAIRYRHTFDSRFRFGFTAESDAGEALFSGSNKQGFDYYSVHLFAQNVNRRVKALALGDYSAKFGQGLLLQTGFSPGKSAETTTISRSGRKLNGYGAFGEAFFFRGAAATIALGKHVEITGLYSNRNRDGNIIPLDTLDQNADEYAFSSLQTSGLHRSSTEIADEKALNEQIGGLSASYLWRQGQVSLNSLYIRYDKPWTPAYAPYRKYAFTGQHLSATSIDYRWQKRNWLLFGETAASDNGAVATVNGLLLSPDQHITFSALHRYFPADYQSIYAAPFAETSGASNEQGLYVGTDIRFIRRLQINMYADVFQHPWLRFGVDAPSRGREFLGRVLWTKSKTFSVYLLWQSEIKEKNSDFEFVPGLVDNRRDRLRLHAVYKVSPAIEFRSRMEWTTFQVAQDARSQGFLIYQEAVWKPLSFPLSASLRYALFDTDNYDTRVFAYESDLFSAVSIPSFAGRGTRYYANVKWRVNKWLRLEARVEQTVLDKAVTSTAVSGKETYWKLQARIKI